MFYRSSMPSVILRLLTALAVMLMPLGMSNALASAPHTSPALAAAADGACGDHRAPTEAPGKSNMHCAACASLPAMEGPQQALQAPVSVPTVPIPVRWILGLEAEVATPPPKLV